MPGYIQQLLAKFKHKKPTKPQHSPYHAVPRIYAVGADKPILDDDTRKVDEARVKRVQQVVGGILYFSWAVDLTTLPALISIASEQTNATEKREEKVKRILDFLATKPDVTIWYHKLKIILNIHLDASHLSEAKARSRATGYLYMGANIVNGQPIPLNWALYVYGSILKFVVASAAEAELGAPFLNCQEGKIIQLVLHELGHP